MALDSAKMPSLKDKLRALTNEELKEEIKKVEKVVKTKKKK